jgi:hypothetical protein
VATGERAESLGEIDDTEAHVLWRCSSCGLPHTWRRDEAVLTNSDDEA